MLSKLSLKNVALIERADITFSEGLNVLSGETGAGKSVILDSINFVLGAKADRTMIRHGESECFVKAEFILPETARAVAVLREMDVETDGEIILSRRLTDTGKSTVKINGNTVTTAMLRKVTDSLVDVHGQSEHFFLLKESNQLKTLDSVVGVGLLPLKERLKTLLVERKSVLAQMDKLGGDEKERGRRLDVLRFQIDEIEGVNLQEGEEDELLAKRNKIVNLEKIISAFRGALSALEGEGGVSDGLRAAARSLGNVTKLDEGYGALCDRLETLSEEVDDVTASLNDATDELYFDENEANEVESRLDAVRALKRKYGANKKEIDAYLEGIRQEYDLLSDCEGKFAELTEALSKIEREIYKACQSITALRKKEGNAFCTRVTAELKTLNIASARFDIAFTPYTEADVAKANIDGLDNICFLFSANAGEPMKPLGKIISGGEMSRFMLAIKTQLSSVNEISTYIFDEIDAGISGKTAKVVGEKLAKIAKKTQILAVSHLAQIAVMSDAEYLIEKKEENGKTLTIVRALNEAEKTQEIVRLLGGSDGDEFAKKHAEELLKQADAYKLSINSQNE